MMKSKCIDEVLELHNSFFFFIEGQHKFKLPEAEVKRKCCWIWYDFGFSKLPVLVPYFIQPVLVKF
jgi:hypothetical protein